MASSVVDNVASLVGGVSTRRSVASVRSGYGSVTAAASMPTVPMTKAAISSGHPSRAQEAAQTAWGFVGFSDTLSPLEALLRSRITTSMTSTRHRRTGRRASPSSSSCRP